MFLYEAALCRTAGVMRHQHHDNILDVMFSLFTASQSHENVRHNFNKLLFVTVTDMMLMSISHMVRGSHQNECPRAPPQA